MVRQPAVAGRFYPAQAEALAAEVDQMLQTDQPPQPALAVVCPHAGYVFSGRVAGQVFGQVTVPRRVLLMGPNHSGMGRPAALMSRGQWRTPLGLINLDDQLGQAIMDRAAYVEQDDLAHRNEHSLEVQTPFLQRRQAQLLLTPLCLALLGVQHCLDLGRAIAEAIAALGEPVLIVASTDMSHYIPAAQAKALDELAIERIMALDAEGLHHTVLGRGISMCGVVPTTVALAAAVALGASRARLAAYANSGQVTGDEGEVVAYAGLIID